MNWEVIFIKEYFILTSLIIYLKNLLIYRLQNDNIYVEIWKIKGNLVDEHIGDWKWI